MKAYLLDVNVLLALAWPNHVHHRPAVMWFNANRHKGWATCAVTELAFIRLSSHPVFTPHPSTPATAIELLEKLTRLSRHRFWPDKDSCTVTPDFRQCLDRVGTHHHVTDAYLASAAARNGGLLATFDRSLKDIFPDLVELL